MNKKIAVTGVTGKKSGRIFAEYLSDNKPPIDNLFEDGINVLVRPSSNVSYIKELLPDANICTGDINDDAFLEKAFENVDTIVHIAGILFTEKIVNAAITKKVRRLILVHTTGIYSKYKSAGENYRKIDEYTHRKCKENNIILTICRPTMIYGNIYDRNIVNFIKMVDKFPLMPVVNGAKYELQPVNYKDLGKAYFDILINEETTANKDFNLSGEKPIQLRDILSKIGEKLGKKKVKFISCPYFIAYAGACALYGLSFGKYDYREKVQRLCEPRVYSHEEATNTFGFSPISFDVGIAEEVQEYINSKGNQI